MAHRIELKDLLNMNKDQVADVFRNGHPLDLNQVENNQYFGIDLGMPGWFHKYFWLTFRKTFYRDPQSGILRGWNVKLEQQGINGPRVPKKNKDGSEKTFAHYHVQSAKGLKFPKGWQGADFLNYLASPNKFGEGTGYCPIVAINEGDMNLLLGWEVFKYGPFFVPLNDYWVLVKEGPIETLAPVPGSK